MFCSPGLIFGGTVGVGSRFHVLRPHIRFRRVPLFMYWVPVLVFGGSEGVGSRFQVLRSRTRF
jgi:hypothetical protein